MQLTQTMCKCLITCISTSIIVDVHLFLCALVEYRYFLKAKWDIVKWNSMSSLNLHLRYCWLTLNCLVRMKNRTAKVVRFNNNGRSKGTSHMAYIIFVAMVISRNGSRTSKALYLVLGSHFIVMTVIFLTFLYSLIRLRPHYLITFKLLSKIFIEDSYSAYRTIIENYKFIQGVATMTVIS